MDGALPDPGVDATLTTQSINPASRTVAVPADAIVDADAGNGLFGSAGTVKGDERLDAVTIANAVTSVTATGQPIQWSNAATGSNGLIHGIGERKADGGGLCRDFTALRTSYDGVRNYAGSVCMSADGLWRIARFDAL
jgi:hypothetical protein